MIDKVLKSELGSLSNDLAGIHKAFSSGKNRKTCEKKLRKSGILERIGKIDKYGDDVMMIAPLLAGILECDNVRFFPELVSAISIELGKNHIDGFVTKYAFIQAVKGTQIRPEEVVRELEAREYIRDGFILPSFRPQEESFSFKLDERFLPILDRIRDALLAVSSELHATLAMLKRLPEPECEPIQNDIIYGLTEIGHPACIPVLLGLAKKNNKDAAFGLVMIALREMHELSELARKGVTRDLWGNNLREKALAPFQEIIPLLLQMVQSDDYSVDERRQIALAYDLIDKKRASDVEVFINTLEVLALPELENCPVSRVIISAGKQSVPFLIKCLHEKQPGPAASARIVEILGRIGAGASESIQEMKKLAAACPEIEGLIRRTIEIIQKPGLELEYGSAHDMPESASGHDAHDDDVEELESIDDAGDAGTITAGEITTTIGTLDDTAVDADTVDNESTVCDFIVPGEDGAIQEAEVPDDDGRVFVLEESIEPETVKKPYVDPYGSDEFVLY